MTASSCMRNATLWLQVWDNLKCADKIYKCIKDCGHGLESCIGCMGPMWDRCCCCLDNAGIHGLPCPSCCNQH
jgi:hypothetical protein